MKRAVPVLLSRVLDSNQTCWVENECLGTDQDVRVTRGPITLKGGVARLNLYVENRHMYQPKEVKKGMLVGQLVLTDIVDSLKPKVGLLFKDPGGHHSPIKQ
jgi:hypothetical protein